MYSGFTKEEACYFEHKIEKKLIRKSEKLFLKIEFE
jgi:hypothetical protein